MKILFTDVDGVLNSADYMRNRRAIRRPSPHAIDAVTVPRLNTVTDRTGAKIVISSSWRIGKAVERLREIFALHGITGDVIGLTPSLYEWYTKDDKVCSKRAERGFEIDCWLDEWPSDPRFAELGPVESFAIVDDNSDMVHLAHRLVKTDWDTGLLDEHVERLIIMLNQ